MRRGMDLRIAETIMGHALRQKDVPGQYLSCSDDDLLSANNCMRFDNGKTDIWLATRTKENPAVTATGNHASKTRGAPET